MLKMNNATNEKMPDAIKCKIEVIGENPEKFQTRCRGAEVMKKKLIEVALPLEAINCDSGRDNLRLGPLSCLYARTGEIV